MINFGWHARVARIAMALALALGGVLGARPGVTADARESLNGDQLSVGDVVAVGRPSVAGCEFPEQVQGSQSAPSDGTTRWLGFTIDARCRVTVSAGWAGELSDGPPHIIEPLEALMGTESEPVPARPTSEDQTSFAASGGDAGIQPAAIQCKFNRQHIFMFGFGGSGDKLTNLQTEMEFCYDFTNAIVNAHKGSCWGATLAWWRWKVDGCWITFKTQGSAPNVRVSHRGDYHCDPTNVAPCNASNPDGYHHRLFSSIHGAANGGALCNWGWDGIIVAQVQRTVLFGCS